MKKTIFALALISSLGTTSCEKFLDKRDPTATNFQEFFNTEEDLRRVVYSSYRDVFTHPTDRRLVFYMLDGRSDNGYARIETDHHGSIAHWNHNRNARAAEYYWSLCNKRGGRLNTLSANVDIPYGEDENVRQKYKGVLEGRRVWQYIRIGSHCGDVPFVLEPANSET